MRWFSTAGPPIMNCCIKNAEPSFCLFFSHSVLCSEVNLVLMEFGFYLFIGGNCKLLSSEILSATLTSNHDVILIFWSWLQIFTLCSNRDQELAELAAALTEVGLAGLLDLWVSSWTRVRVSQSTRLKWEKKHVWQHIAAVCGCVPLLCSHQPLRWSPSLHWPTRTARELCSGQQSKLTMTPPPPPTTDSNASRGHESSLMRSLKPEHNCEAEWPINNPIALETVHSSVNPHVSLVRRLSGGVFMSLWCPLETFLMNRYGDVLGLVSSLLQREQPSQPAAARSVWLRLTPRRQSTWRDSRANSGCWKIHQFHEIGALVCWICLRMWFPPFMSLQGMYIKSTYDGLHVITGTTEGVSSSYWSRRYNEAAANG